MLNNFVSVYVPSTKNVNEKLNIYFKEIYEMIKYIQRKYRKYGKYKKLLIECRPGPTIL
jgi:hypothetical protein